MLIINFLRIFDTRPTRIDGPDSVLGLHYIFSRSSVHGNTDLSILDALVLRRFSTFDLPVVLLVPLLC
jgi:hypothetical protein